MTVRNASQSQQSIFQKSEIMKYNEDTARKTSLIMLMITLLSHILFNSEKQAEKHNRGGWLSHYMDDNNLS